MPVALERYETGALIRLEGECSVACAAELKTLLLEGLAVGGELRLDLDQAGEMDLTAFQLLWAAGREADRRGTRIVAHMPESAASAAREAGFARFPGPTIQE